GGSTPGTHGCLAWFSDPRFRKGFRRGKKGHLMNKPIGRLRRRILITDGEARAALSACRALRSAGYEVDAVASDGPALVHWSRYCSRRLWAPDPRVDRGAFA